MQLVDLSTNLFSRDILTRSEVLRLTKWIYNFIFRRKVSVMSVKFVLRLGNSKVGRVDEFQYDANASRWQKFLLMRKINNSVNEMSKGLESIEITCDAVLTGNKLGQPNPFMTYHVIDCFITGIEDRAIKKAFISVIVAIASNIDDGILTRDGSVAMIDVHFSDKIKFQKEYEGDRDVE